MNEILQLGEQICSKIDALIAEEKRMCEKFKRDMEEISYEYYKQTNNLREIGRYI